MISMRRLTLQLPEGLLNEAHRLSGESSYSATVTKSLEEFVSRARAASILDLAGREGWSGDLTEMRGDSSD